ncbi:hypothetical protein diail_8611 [Diaporthe ilicicola]|nr:hypothetical protein diail_8611 [Diaporthe ilicicola]
MPSDPRAATTVGDLKRRPKRKKASKMPPQEAELDCDVKQYFQYHNRIASFLDWKLEWEVNKSKPTPEALARAGFFSYTKAPFIADNTICPYCSLTLDKWQADDDPMHEHIERSPDCPFMSGAIKPNGEPVGARSISVAEKEAKPSEQKTSANKAPQPKQSGRKRTTAGESKAKELAVARANDDDDDDDDEGDRPVKRRRGRPAKQSRGYSQPDDLDPPF